MASFETLSYVCPDVFFGGKRVAMRSVSSGTIYYYEEDMLGTSRTLVQAGQTSVCYDADFYPFGGERDVTRTDPPGSPCRGPGGPFWTQNYKFEGKERDTETGNDDFGARYYTSRLGRWLSADWSAVPIAVPYANLTNPQTLNLYAMVSDNPETFDDLDGHGCSLSLFTLETSCSGTVEFHDPAPGEGFTAKPNTGDGQPASDSEQAAAAAEQSDEQKKAKQQYLADDYYLDYKGHGGPHIDRVDKNGNLVGRYDENGNPIKFKGKNPPQIPNSDKSKFGKAAGKLRDYKDREREHAERVASPTSQKKSPANLRWNPFFWYLPGRLPFTIPMPEPVPMPEPIPF